LPYHNILDGEYYGFSRELFDTFARKHGYQFIYRPLPIKRLFKLFVEQNGIDFKYPDHYLWQQDIKKDVRVIYSDPVISYIEGIMVLQENINIGIQDLNHICTVFGFTPWPYQGLIKNGRIIVSETRNIQDALTVVIKSRSQGAYINVAVADYQMEHTLKSSKILELNTNLPHISDYYHLSTIKYPEVVRALNLFLEKETTTINMLKEKHDIEGIF